MPISSNSIHERVTRYLTRAELETGSRTQQLAGDASSRVYVRLTTPTGNTRMLVVYPDSVEIEKLPYLNVSHLLTKLGIRTPTTVSYDAELGIVEVEDLGDLTLHKLIQTAAPKDRTQHYLEAVSIIHQIQRNARNLDKSSFSPFNLCLGEDRLLWELEFFVKHFLVNARRASLKPGHRDALHEEFSRLASEINVEPRVLCHRDFHSRNLMLYQCHFYVIDFQDACMGPQTYDLVSLLRDCYVDNTSEFVDQMIDEYLKLVNVANPREFKRRFDVMSVQRHLKALGTFGYQSSVAGNVHYLDNVPRTLNYLRSVFKNHERFDQLRVLLAQYVPELG